MPQILIVEDEPAIREMIQGFLVPRGYRCREAEDTREALALIAKAPPDLILLDWMLPDRPGLELARQLKRSEASHTIPIIMLTARAEESDKVQGLESGADDYITKPFSLRELTARIEAVLRRAPRKPETRIEIDGLGLERESHRVTVGGKPINLGPKEYQLLEFFISHPERLYSRAKLIELIWGHNTYVEERTVDVHVRRLRQALEPGGHDRLIQTVRGSGYRLSKRDG